MRTVFLVLISIGLISNSTASAAPNVVASILPVHSLVNAVLDGVSEAQLLLPAGASPHDYALRPSDMRTLNNAEVLFWIGPELETALVRPLASIPSVRAEALLDTPDLRLLRLRDGGLWESEQHIHTTGTASSEAASSGTEQLEHATRHDWDAHIWLNPANAQRMLTRIVTVLSELDASNSARYAANAQAYQERISTLSEQLVETLKPVKHVPYIVFHDAYQYFEQYFDLHPIGSITLHPERRPGAQRLQAMRDRIQENKIRCVFSEPQFQSALVQTLIENSDTRSAVLDPMGTNLKPGPTAYLDLLEQLAKSLHDCLAGD